MPKDKTLNYKDMSAELDDVMSSLQQEDIDVDDALKLYERGLELINRLEDYLKGAENRVVELKGGLGSSKKSRRREA